MKKRTKIAATLAALVLALALAGCDNDEEPTEENGQADWSGFTMVDSVDKLDFKVGKYEYTEVSNIEYESISMSMIGINMVEISSSGETTVTKISRAQKYNDDVSYNEAKKEIIGTKSFSYDDSTRTITKTYSEGNSTTFPTLSFALKELYFFPEDEINDNYSSTYTDKKLGNKDGVIQASYTETHTRIEGTTKDTETYHTIITLTPQK
ncbi:MAG: hypothetical protein K2K67_09170 [Treponemataceae bacterium]|nr:hypothetical protein [Treponemataceae bacterium]